MFSDVAVHRLSVCASLFDNGVTLEPFEIACHHKIFMGARYGQKLGRVRKWLHSDACKRL